MCRARGLRELEECADACRRLTTRLFKRTVARRDFIFYYYYLFFSVLSFLFRPEFTVPRTHPSAVLFYLLYMSMPIYIYYIKCTVITYVIRVRRPLGVQKLTSLSLFFTVGKINVSTLEMLSAPPRR